MLTEQVSAQNEKINDLERLIVDKSQHVSTTEDLLQRERLTRSSLETQKLELMSAMSELKLQQAVLERENLELRASHFNNNTIGSDRRLPPVPNTRLRTNSNSGSMVCRACMNFTHAQNKQCICNILCVFFFWSSSNRHHLQRIDVKRTSTTIVCHGHRCQIHLHRYRRAAAAVRQTIQSTIQMQIQNEMSLHSVNSL